LTTPKSAPKLFDKHLEPQDCTQKGSEYAEEEEDKEEEEEPDYG